MCKNFRQKFCLFDVLTINATNITEYLALYSESGKQTSPQTQLSRFQLS
jgi:hypothetical protein